MYGGGGGTGGGGISTDADGPETTEAGLESKPESGVVVVSDGMKDSGDAAETVCESDTGDSDLEAAVLDPVSDGNGEYFLAC